MNASWSVGWCLALAAVLAACGKPAAEGRRFEVRGVVQEVKDGGRVLVIDHEAIPGYMQAMIMPFQVKKPAEAAGLSPGDEVQFTYVVEGFSSWIERIQRTGRKGEIKRQAGLPGEPAAAPLAVGDPLPDYEFLDENGKLVKLSDFRGGPVALSFIFTRCPVPEFCPATMRKFAAVRTALAGDPAAPANWRLLTISFDSAHDVPAVMKSYGAAFGQDGKGWSMLSSQCCSIQELAANVGLRFGEVKGSYEHNLRTVVLDAGGRIRQVFTDQSWTPEALVAGIKAAANPLPSAPQARQDALLRP